MTPEREAEVRALVERIASEHGRTWGRSALGLWTTPLVPGAAACEALPVLLAALDEARRERDEKVAEVERVRDRLAEARDSMLAARLVVCLLLDGHLSPSDAVRQSAISAAMETRRGWGM